MRRPAVAGTFYEGTREALMKRIEWCYTHPHGPGEVPKAKVGRREIVGLVSPHAGYVYSGPVAAHGFSSLARDGKPGSFVILGPNHTGVGSGVSIVTSGKWLTPLGEVEIDGELAEAIRKASELIDVDEVAHAHEHSLEVQLPFMQHLFGRVKMVPICMMMQDRETSEDVGGAIAEACAGKDVVIIASTDFTHYEPQRSAVVKDRKAIDEILKLDWRGLLRVVDSEDISMCGYGPVAAMLRAAKELGARRAELLKYATSGDTAGPMPQVVGYGSVVVMR